MVAQGGLELCAGCAWLNYDAWGPSNTLGVAQYLAVRGSVAMLDVAHYNLPNEGKGDLMKRTTNLRHLLGLALTAIMLSGVVLSGCGGGSDDDTTSASNNAAPAAKDAAEDE